MKHFLITLLTALLLMQGQAQSILQQFTEHPERSGGVYYAYPEPTDVQMTAPPAGYTPFYISHYGRHGSRYMIGDIDYLRPLDMLEKADSAQMLTELGKDVLQRLRTVWNEAEGHTDELAPLGKLQHRGIAERMYAHYPEVFEHNAKISARSTISTRCALSMWAFCERLKELDPTLNIDWETSKKNMSYLCYHSEAYERVKNNPDGWQKDYRRFCERKREDPMRFVSQLIKDPAWLKEADIEPQRMLTAFYDVAGDLQDMQCGITLYDLFTPDELLECWRNGNAWFYYSDADAAGNQKEAIKSCSHLLKNILDKADAAIAGCGEAATLRFGHDGNIIPLAACLHLEHCDDCITNPDSIELVWQNYYVAPMAGNIQLIFYRKDSSDDILVKVLLHERETRITTLTSDVTPYYHWKDLKKMIEEEIADAE